MRPCDTHPSDCPPFEYESHPTRGTEVPRRVALIVATLFGQRMDTLAAASDTRSVHGTLFDGLTPPGHPYFAGHYRGESYRCLQRYQVRAGDRRCCPPHRVPMRMADLGSSIEQALAALDAGHASRVDVSAADKLHHIVRVACCFFELICRVHPYANGNGHAARFCLWAILTRYGYFPRNWPIDPRPQETLYTDLLLQHRAGKPEGLEQHILECLTPIRESGSPSTPSS